MDIKWVGLGVLIVFGIFTAIWFSIVVARNKGTSATTSTKTSITTPIVSGTKLEVRTFFEDTPFGASVLVGAVVLLFIGGLWFTYEDGITEFFKRYGPVGLWSFVTIVAAIIQKKLVDSINHYIMLLSPALWLALASFGMFVREVIKLMNN